MNTQSYASSKCCDISTQHSIVSIKFCMYRKFCGNEAFPVTGVCFNFSTLSADDV